MSRRPRPTIRALYVVRDPLFGKLPALFAEDAEGRLWRAARAGDGGSLLLRPLRSGARLRRRAPLDPERTPRIACGFAELFLEILDARGAARRLGLSERFVRAAARRGRIPGAFRAGGGGRAWLFREAGLAWYARHRKRGRPPGSSRKSGGKHGRPESRLL